MSRLEECKKTDIVSFLSKEGYQPKKKSGNKFWYSSPIRGGDSDPSFVVFINTNRWSDLGDDMRSGDIIDLVEKMNNCDKKTALDILSGDAEMEKFEPVEIDTEPLISVTRTLEKYISPNLLLYLQERGISPETYNRFTKQAFYSFKANPEKEFHAVSLRNDRGGFELRSKIHKFCTSPKYPTTYINGSSCCSVMEGLFDFLAAVEYFGDDLFQTDVFVLNGLGMINTVIDQISRYKVVNIYLDLGIGANNTINLIKSRMYDGIVVDHRYLYAEGCKDFNEHWCKLNNKQK